EGRLRGRVTLLDKPLTDGVCPLFFPLLVRDKAASHRALAARGIETIEFWNSGDPDAERNGSDAQFLRKHVLEIPIHQDVTPEKADFMVDQILKLGVSLAA